MTTTLTADHEAKRAALHASVFGTLSATQLDRVAHVSDTRHVEAGGTLCLQGECSQEAFVIVDGSVAVLAGEAEVATFGPGDVVGDWALFGGGRRTATLRALTDVDAVVIDDREMDFLLMAVPAAARVLGPHTGGDVR